MKALGFLLAAVLLGCLGACGAGSRSGAPATGSSSHTQSVGADGLRPLDSDGDREVPAVGERDDAGILYFGHPASSEEAHAVGQVVRAYYGAALADAGAGACSMMSSALASSVPADYGRPPGPRSLRGATCAVVMTKLFAQRHAELAAPAGALALAGVRVRADHALALLGASSKPRRYLSLLRQGGVWRVQE